MEVGLSDETAALFAYGNIGVLISMDPAGDPDKIPFIASAQMEKIDQNLAPEIIQYRETLRQSRLSPADYDKYKAEVVNVDLSGLTKISDGDSLWLMKDEGVKMGIRKEWEDEKGRVVGIDICKLESNEMAQEVAFERAKMSDGKVVDELGLIPWNDKRSSKILVHGSAVIHVYYLNHEYPIGPAYYLPPVSSPMNPIYYDRLGLPFFYYNHPYYNLGSYYSRFPASPSLIIIRNLHSIGIYPLDI